MSSNESAKELAPQIKIETEDSTIHTSGEPSLLSVSNRADHEQSSSNNSKTAFLGASSAQQQSETLPTMDLLVHRPPPPSFESNIMSKGVRRVSNLGKKKVTSTLLLQMGHLLSWSWYILGYIICDTNTQSLPPIVMDMSSGSLVTPSQKSFYACQLDIR